MNGDFSVTKKRIEEYLKKSLRNVYKGDFEKLVDDTLSEKRAEEQIELLSSFTGEIKGKKLLEIGSGFGMFVLLSRMMGAESYGIEPDDEVYNLSLDVLTHYGLERDFIIKCKGEELPFKEGSFDIVFSTNVLEHVGDPEQVILEGIRVLKRGGYLQFVVPNYGSFWEGHYAILWLPNLPKPLAKIYVALLGRDPSYLDSLHININQQFLKDIVERIKGIEVVDWGYEVWKKRLLTQDFSPWAGLKKLKN